MSADAPVEPARLAERRPTQKLVASAAGVSQAAVSIVLNNPDCPALRPGTRARIQKVARELGYVPNRPAQMLRAAQSQTLACVIPDITNPFYPGLVRGLQSIAGPAGYDVLIYDTYGVEERERRALEWLLHGRADGVVGTFFHLRVPDLAELLRHRIAVARLENREKPLGDLPLDNIFIDNAAAAAAMTRLLVERGHRHIALIAGELGPGGQRALGYMRVMREAGLDPDIVTDREFTEAGGKRCMQRLLRRRRGKVSAVFGASDLLAIGAMAAIREAGLAIPSDVAVAGFDDIPAAKLLMPALTTVRQPEQEIGALAAEILIGRLRPNGLQAPGGNHRLPFEIVLRASV
ncbi:MAG: LacI family DNA-binding transcriptional regulator [Reyranellales bacterium]